MSSRPPLAGYNHNVNYRHRRYHVQTEDSGTENPRIDTHLFHGGLIIESAKTDYSHLLDTPDAKAATKALMQNQHKGLMKKLIHGGLDEKIIALIGTLDPEEAISALVLDDEEAPEAGADVAAPGEAAPEEAESEEAESEEAESEEAESDEVESEEAAPEEAESDEVAPELAAQEEAEPEEAAQEDAEPKAAQAAEAIDETDADPTQSEEAPAAMAEVIPAEEPEPIALSAFEGEETVEPVANLITTEQAEDDQIYVTGEDLYSSEELADSEEHPSVEVDSGYEDEVYTSVSGLDDLYQELDEDVSPGAGAAQGEVPQFEAGASSEEESFDFEMDPGETGEVPSVDEYIEKERQEVLTSSEYSTVDAKKDETFEVTLDTRIPPLPPEPEEDTDSVFGELSLEDEQTPPPYNRPTAEAAPDQAPDVSSGSREDWPQLDYPDDANRGRYDMDQAGADEVLSTTDFDDAYADLDPGSTADDGYVDYPPGDAYSHGLGIDTEATIYLYPDES